MISFNVGKAAKYLMDNGVVYTIRGRRTEGWHDLYINGELQKERVFVDLVAMAFDTPLASYVARSGFTTVLEWREAAKSIHGKGLSGMGIYRVTLAGRKEMKVIKRAVQSFLWVCRCHDSPIIPVQIDASGTTRPRCQVSGNMISEREIEIRKVYRS